MHGQIAYLHDQHVVTGPEAAYVRIFKLWLPDYPLPVVTNNSIPSARYIQPWWVHSAQLSIVHTDGKAFFGMRMAVVEVGSSRDCGYLGAEWQGPTRPAMLHHPQPVLYGFGWTLYPQPLVAGDVVIFRAKYEVMR